MEERYLHAAVTQTHIKTWGNLAMSGSSNLVPPSPPTKRLPQLFRKTKQNSFRRDFTSQIASKSISEDLKSEIFCEGHASSPDPQDNTSYSFHPKLKILDTTLTYGHTQPGFCSYLPAMSSANIWLVGGSYVGLEFKSCFLKVTTCH